MLDVTEMTNLAVDLFDVHKTYRRGANALRGVSIQVGRREIFGLLGPNGAGKTTLVKIMTTIVRPSRAAGTILGRPIGNRRKLARIGYLPENHHYPPYLTGRQVLDYCGALALVPRAVRRRRAAELLERVGMTPFADQRVSKYSKGMLQRVGIAEALINDPELVILDEPTDGLDPVGRREVRLMLTELKQQGVTIFLNSHLLSELEMVCDRVAILVNGLVARQGTLSQLTEHTLEYRIGFTGDVAPLCDKLAAMKAQVVNGQICLPGRDANIVNELIDLLRANKVLIECVEPHRFSLEDVFVETMLGTQPPPAAGPAGSARGKGT